jgi:hypothetical protein
VRSDFIPNPSYQPQSMAEKILHEVVGSMLVDRKEARLHLLEGHLPQDVNIGFGLLATISQVAIFLPPEVLCLATSGRRRRSIQISMGEHYFQVDFKK